VKQFVIIVVAVVVVMMRIIVGTIYDLVLVVTGPRMAPSGVKVMAAGARRMIGRITAVGVAVTTSVLMGMSMPMSVATIGKSIIRATVGMTMTTPGGITTTASSPMGMIVAIPSPVGMAVAPVTSTVGMAVTKCRTNFAVFAAASTMKHQTHSVSKNSC